MVIFITGGIKSGKTAYAIELAKRYENRCYLATAEPFDDEMRNKIVKHRAERRGLFKTIEEPLDVDNRLKDIKNCDVVVFDCLTTWLNNLLYYEKNVDEYTKNLLEIIRMIDYDLIIVSNEVGMGLVPMEKMSRDYVNSIGVLNQKIAHIANTCFFMVSGIPIKIK